LYEPNVDSDLKLAFLGYCGSLDFVFNWVSSYGYEALFLLLMLGVVGIPIPDETLLVFTGYLVSRGTMHPAGALATAVCGSWCGISLSYALGRTFGLGAIRKFGRFLRVDDRRLEQVHAWFDRRGHWALFLGYYIAGVRHFTAIVAGASGVRFGTFVAYAWTGGFFWAAGFLTLGYYIGADWRRIADLVHHDLTVASLVLLAAIAAYALFRWKKNRNAAARRPS
jgi:membrane protein DedA with SNARE-associated domain